MSLLIQANVPDSRFVPVFEALIRSVGSVSRADAAKLVQMERRQFTELFAEVHHVTFRRMRQEVRVAAGCCLLRQSGLRVSEIAAFLGYSSARQFRRIFIKRMGQSPAHFRRRLVGHTVKHRAGRVMIRLRLIDSSLPLFMSRLLGSSTVSRRV
jgi:transcriptional regulator GlxA family with amidase domain